MYHRSLGKSVMTRNFNPFSFFSLVSQSTSSLWLKVILANWERVASDVSSAPSRIHWPYDDDQHFTNVECRGR